MERHEIPKDSPTCGKESLRLVLAIVAQNGWRSQSINIKTVFVSAKQICVMLACSQSLNA